MTTTGPPCLSRPPKQQITTYHMETDLYLALRPAEIPKVAEPLDNATSYQV